MSRREADMRARDFLKGGKPDVGRDSRYPPPSSRSDRIRADSRGRDSPRRRVSRSPIRAPRDRIDADYQNFRSKSQEGNRRRSEELREEREISHLRERRARSPRISGRGTPPARSPRLSSRGAPPPAAAAAAADLPHDLVGRNQTEPLMISGRNESYGRQIPTPFPTSSGVKGMGELLGSQGNQSSLNSFGMLVPRSLVMEDGTVRTFYTLPPDPASEPIPISVDDGFGGKFNMPPPSRNMDPGYVGAIARYGADPRQAPADGFHLGESNRVIATQDGRLMDGKLPGQNPFSARDGGLPAWPGSIDLEQPASRRERPPSPHRNSVDLRSQRRASRSPLRDGGPSFVREGASVPLNLPHRDAVHAPQLERLVRPTDIGRRGLADDPELSFRERLGSPSRRGGPREDPRVNSRRGGIGYTGNSLQEEPMRVPEEVRMGLQRGPPVLYQRDALDIYQRETMPRNSPREGRLGLQRSARMSGYMEDPMYEDGKNAIVRLLRSPQREATVNSRGEVNAQRRGSVFRPDMEGPSSPRRRAQLSPKQRMPLTPPNLRQGGPLQDLDFYESDRRAWKRKYGDSADEFFKDGRVFDPDEPEFKRRGRERDPHPDEDFYGRRFSGWRRSDGHGERRAEREDNDHPHGHNFGRRPWGDRGGSPRLPRRGPYPEDDGRVIDYDDYHDDHPRFNGKPNRFHKEGGVYADKGRSWHGDDMQRSDFVRESEQQSIVPDLPEDSPEFKQQMHRAYVKYVKALNENPGQRKRYEEQGKAGTLLCLVCSRFSKPFVDTHSLVMHTHMSRKRGLRAEHLGLCKAVCTLMGWSSVIEPGNGKSYQQIPAEEAKANKEDLILWPPAVVVHNASTSKRSDGQQEGGGNPEIEELLKELGLSHGKTKIVDGRQGTMIVKYLATFSCLHEAERLHEHFATNGHGREDWFRVHSTDKEPDSTSAEEGPDFLQEDAETKEKKRVLYGYLALAGDLDKVDMDFRRRCLVRSRKEIEAIADDSLTGKKD